MTRKPRDASDLDPEAGERMKQLFARVQAELGFRTEEELWAYLRIGRDTAQRYKRGENPPNPRVGPAIAQRLGMDYASLLNIYHGQEPEIDMAMVIKALEWTLNKMRSGEWPVMQARVEKAPAEGRAEVQKAAARNKPRNPSRRPAA